jgi:hypothetical protein
MQTPQHAQSSNEPRLLAALIVMRGEARLRMLWPDMGRCRHLEEEGGCLVSQTVHAVARQDGKMQAVAV